MQRYTIRTRAEKNMKKKLAIYHLCLMPLKSSGKYDQIYKIQKWSGFSYRFETAGAMFKRLFDCNVVEVS